MVPSRDSRRFRAPDPEMTPEPSAADIYGRDFPVGAVVFEEGDPGSRRRRFEPEESGRNTP